jgi:hypothetical protein
VLHVRVMRGVGDVLAVLHLRLDVLVCVFWTL